MASFDETIYENGTNGTSSQVENESAFEKDTDKDFLKRAAMLGAAVLAGGSIGGGLAYAMKSDEEPEIPEEDDVFQVIEESDDKSFKEAFDDAREQAGPGGVFRWHGKLYNTYTEDEWNSMSDEEKAAFNERIQPVIEDDNHSDNYHHSESSSTHHNHEQHVSRTQTEHVTKVVHTEEYQIGEEGVANIDGQNVIVAQATHDGQPVVLIDINRDGVYDAEARDINGNNKLDEGELTDISGKGVTVHDKSLIGSTPVNNSFEIQQEQVMDVEGHQVIVARASYNGHKAILVDSNRDGYYDGAMVDLNDNGDIEDNEIVDISDQHVAVGDRSLVDPNAGGNEHNVNDEIPVVTIEEEERGMIGDNEVIAAKGTVDGKQAFIVDVNRDGTYDVALVDSNSNGQVDEGDERVNVVSAGAQVRDRSLVDPSGLDTSMDTSEDNIPDYVNTLAANDDVSSEDLVVTVEEDNEQVLADASADTVEIEVEDVPDGESDVAVVEVEESTLEVEVTPLVEVDPDIAVATADDTQYDEAAAYYNDMAFGDDSTQDAGLEMMDDYGAL